MIRLIVNGEPFVIEECEGAPEIRREAAPKSFADRSLYAYPFTEDEKTAHLSVSLKVEAA